MWTLLALVVNSKIWKQSDFKKKLLHKTRTLVSFLENLACTGTNFGNFIKNVTYKKWLKIKFQNKRWPTESLISVQSR